MHLGFKELEIPAYYVSSYIPQVNPKANILKLLESVANI